MIRSQALLEAMLEEFPKFKIGYKEKSRLQKWIHIALLLITFGQQRKYLTGFYTVLFGVLWVPPSWDRLSDADRYILLRHERVHLRQRKRMGDLALAFVYLVPFFPIFLAYGRARIEWEAYCETIRATCEVYGIDRARALKPWLIHRFTGPDYGWMWPFPRVISRWFDEEISKLEADRTLMNTR